MIVDDDAGCDRQPGRRRKLDVRQHADTDHDQIDRDMPAVAEADAGDLGAIGPMLVT